MLHAGGIDTVDAGPTDGIDDVVAAFHAAGTPVAVLCATDALYAERAAPVAARIQVPVEPVHPGLPREEDVADPRVTQGGDALAVVREVYAVLDPEATA